MARLASVSLQNSRPSLTPTVSISLTVYTPCQKTPLLAGCAMKQPFKGVCTVNLIHIALYLIIVFKECLECCFNSNLSFLHVIASHELYML